MNSENNQDMCLKRPGQRKHTAHLKKQLVSLDDLNDY